MQVMLVDVPTRPSVALAQRARARVFSLLGELRRPAFTEELAATSGLRSNGVRARLERPCDAGLVTRDRDRRLRGRPRDTLGSTRAAIRRSAWCDLARWLVRALVLGRAPVHNAEATGRQIGRQPRPRTRGSRLEAAAVPVFGDPVPGWHDAPARAFGVKVRGPGTDVARARRLAVSGAGRHRPPARCPSCRRPPGSVTRS